MPRADDPRDSLALIRSIHPTNQEYDIPISGVRSGCDVTVLSHAVRVVIRLHVVKLGLTILKYRLGVFERHSMFRQVGLRFLTVPLEVIVVSHRRLDRFQHESGTIYGIYQGDCPT